MVEGRLLPVAPGGEGVGRAIDARRRRPLQRGDLVSHDEDAAGNNTWWWWWDGEEEGEKVGS